jgi:hypothetical protein
VFKEIFTQKAFVQDAAGHWSFTGAAPDGGADPELGKIRAERIDDGSLLADEEMADRRN